MQHLEQKLGAEGKFMDLSELEALSHTPGDIVLCIVQEWAKRKAVTVRCFCEISRELGNERVYSILQSSMWKMDFNESVELQSLKKIEI